MQCFTELTPSTAVTHSVCLPFLSAKSTNLVVAKSSLLQIFETKSVIGQAEISSKDDEVEASPHDVAAGTFDRTYFSNDVAFQRLENTTKLVLIGEYPLSGTVTALNKIKPVQTKSDGAALLVAFRDAKFSMVQWDPQIHSISTISIHFYEGEIGKYPWAADLSQYGNHLTVDPSNRCAALSFGAHHLAFLPLRQPGDAIAGDTLDLDGPVNGPDVGRDQTSKKRNGDSVTRSVETPYLSSFVLKTMDFQENITHPIHLTFLHEYREPALGILYASRAPTISNLYERKDVLTYTVFTLDFGVREVTTILSVPDLPYDLFEVIALPPPVGGALLIGVNELVHVDQAGKTNALAVNEFAKQCSSFPMADQSEAGLRLENCIVEQLNDNGDILLVLNTGELVILSFKLDGRSVSGLQVHKVTADKGGSLLITGASCASNLGRGRIFIGSEDADSVLLGCQGRTPPLSRKRSHADMMADDAEDGLDDDDSDDDDIYGVETSPVKQRRRSSAAEFAIPESATFRIHDRLPNLAPIGDFAFGSAVSSGATGFTEGNANKKISLVDMVAPCGRGIHGGLVNMKREVDPVVNQVRDMPGVEAIWSINPKSTNPGDSGEQTARVDPEAQLSPDAQFDKYFITAEVTAEGFERSSVYALTEDGLLQVEKGEFDPDGAAIEVATMADGTRIVQILRSEIKCYDSEFALAQILPLTDESTDAELRVVAASFCDSHVLLLTEDSTVTLLQMTRSGDLEELDKFQPFAAWKWLSGCLYQSEATNYQAFAFLLTAEGGLRIFDLSDLTKPAYASEGLSYVPSTFGPDFVVRRAATKETLTEILVTDIGDAIHANPYLIARTANDDLVIYEPYHTPEWTSSEPFTNGLRWLKIPQPHLAKYSDDPLMEAEASRRKAVLKHFENVGGYRIVFQSGTSPCFVIKEASSAPRVISLRESAVKTFSALHTARWNRGFAYIDYTDILRTCQLPAKCRYGDTGWVMQRTELQEEIKHIVWHQAMGVYAISTSQQSDFKLPDDDYHHEWAKEETTFLPTSERDTVKLLYPGKWLFIDEFELEPCEVVMSMKVLHLEISEHTHERKPFLAVGTAIVRGEDLACEGHIYLFEVITVVPEPGRPETNRRMKLIVQEKVKGAVTALSEVGTQGFLLMAMGQKCHVRGLKEDNSFLPVAFLDMQTYVTVIKNILGTGMLLFGDAVKGVWLTGYMVRYSSACVRDNTNTFIRRSLISSRLLAKALLRWKSSPPNFFPGRIISTSSLQMAIAISTSSNTIMRISAPFLVNVSSTRLRSMLAISPSA
jgi:cleavage and polyadenylation specificity factor subunit 1